MERAIVDSRSGRKRPPHREPVVAHPAEQHGQQAECPWCHHDHAVRVSRGLIGPTDERDQYITCDACGQVTYEIVSRTMRDIRVGRFQVGGTWRDNARQVKYTITRILKVGMNESLLYVKPVIPTDRDRAV